MDFDALVNLKRIIMADNVTDTDIMLLKSAINNRSVDINISISENLDYFFKDNIDDDEFMIYLEEFINCDDYYLNTPIYKVFLTRRCFFVLLSIALLKKSLTDETFYDIINTLFRDLGKANGEEYALLLVLIQDMISSKGKVLYESLNCVDVIMDFIVSNIYSLFESEPMFNDVLTKDIILKLFSYGYIHFSDFISYDEGILFLKMFIHAIFDMGDYSYLLPLLNDKMLDEVSAECVKSVIDEYKCDDGPNGKLCTLMLEKIETFLKNSQESERKPLM